MDAPAFGAIRLQYDDARGVATIVLDRPDKLNALTDEMLEEIEAAVEHCRRLDDEADGVAVRALVMEGVGDRSFSAGYDVHLFEEKTYPVEERAWRAATAALETYDVPVVAKIDGYCLGGGLELALACDFRLASDRSEFGFPEVDIGLFPSGGGTQRLLPLVGRERAMELCMTGNRIDARTAADDGLIRESMAADVLDDEVTAFVDTLASKPPLAIRAMKDVFNSTRNAPLSQGLEYELQAYQPLLATADHREATAAFGDDRTPEWQGK
ncbi:enoyl-CoA hydratase/isomerase family protein [Halosolutus amylolyticus]|uniref:Enoyl-CoA hydratase/isomerase family protein n=1 Tax=Halosolutus amylolyticus TaxID=2932267 RepID=A0ABD5PJI8_9EURY|nr:enoyl-CoA hydratase/isomerase family protein [Halosolutus amylolyticus]